MNRKDVRRLTREINHLAGRTHENDPQKLNATLNSAHQIAIAARQEENNARLNGIRNGLGIGSIGSTLTAIGAYSGSEAVTAAGLLIAAGGAALTYGESKQAKTAISNAVGQLERMRSKLSQQGIRNPQSLTGPVSLTHSEENR